MDNTNFVVHPFVKKETIQKRLYQELLTAEAIKQSTLVVAPTGLGKTIIAVLLIAYTYNPKKSIILLSPTKPLISQHKKSITKFLEIPEDKVILLTGETSQEKRKDFYDGEGLVICATPQTVQHDLEKKLLDPKHFNLVIFDEAHRAVGSYSYTFISQYFSDDVKRLGLTASPGATKAKIQEVADNLGINHIEIRTEKDHDVKDYVNDIEVDIRFLELDSLSKEISKTIDNYIQHKIELLRKLGCPIPTNYSKKQVIAIQAGLFEKVKRVKNNTGFIAISVIASVLKFLHAKELIETQGFSATETYLLKLKKESLEKKSKALSAIVNSSEFVETLKLLEKAKAKKCAKEIALLDIVSDFLKQNPKSRILVFNNYRDNANHLVEVLNQTSSIKSTRFVGQASKSLSDKGLSQKTQGKIISDFREGQYNVLVCTSVGEEGLDIPSVDLVIFYDAVASEIRNIQRRGRTGRFDIGKVILLLNKDTIDEKYYFVSQNKEKKMKSILQNFHKPERKKKEQKKLSDY